MNFSPFPLLESERLLLRSLSENDKEAVFFLRTDKTVNKFIDRNKPTNTEKALDFIKDIQARVDRGESIYWAISLKDKPELIGTICLHNFSVEDNNAELGYEMNPAFHKQGLMTEALNCVKAYAFEQIGLKSLEAFTQKNNADSVRLLEKHGFTLMAGRVDEDYPLNIIFELKKVDE